MNVRLHFAAFSLLCDHVSWILLVSVPDRAAKTAEEKQRRLKERRERDRARRATQSVEEREARLERTRVAEQERLTAEMHEEREARLENEYFSTVYLLSKMSAPCYLTTNPV